MIPAFVRNVLEQKLRGKKTIAIDFDGPVHKYSKGWYDGTIYDPPTPGVKEALELLSKKYRLVLFTCRVLPDQPNGLRDVKKWLKENDLSKYFSNITYKKPRASFYIDDNAVVFKNNWPKVLTEIKKRASTNER